MTKQPFAISLQSVNHVDRGNGVAAALKRDFGRGHGLQPTCISTDGMVLMAGLMLGGMALHISSDLFSGNLFSGNLSRFGQPLFGRDGLDGHQLGGAAAFKQESGRYRDGITVLTQH